MKDKAELEDQIREAFLHSLEKNIPVDVPVYGLSMFPFYLPGDKVRVEKSNIDNLKVGEAIIFISSKKMVCHRLLKILDNEGKIIAKGDGLLKKDPIIHIDDVKGVVIKHFRNGRELKIFNNSFIKRSIAQLSIITGFFLFPLGRIWYKLALKNIK